MDSYSLIKLAHLIAVTIFIGGLIFNGFLLLCLPPDRSRYAALIKATRIFNGPFIGTALLAVWGLGLTLAYMGSWFSDIWLMAKMAIVFLLSGLHGAQAGAFRKMQTSPDRPVPAILRYSLLIVIVSLAVVIFLVFVKPG
jgi:putative membrane protein